MHTPSDTSFHIHHRIDLQSLAIADIDSFLCNQSRQAEFGTAANTEYHTGNQTTRKGKQERRPTITLQDKPHDGPTQHPILIVTTAPPLPKSPPPLTPLPRNPNSPVRHLFQSSISQHPTRSNPGLPIHRPIIDLITFNPPLNPPRFFWRSLCWRDLFLHSLRKQRPRSPIIRQQQHHHKQANNNLRSNSSLPANP